MQCMISNAIQCIMQCNEWNLKMFLPCCGPVVVLVHKHVKSCSVGINTQYISTWSWVEYTGQVPRGTWLRIHLRWRIAWRVLAGALPMPRFLSRPRISENITKLWLQDNETSCVFSDCYLKMNHICTDCIFCKITWGWWSVLPWCMSGPNKFRGIWPEYVCLLLLSTDTLPRTPF